jgi:hypothetical protein
MHFITRNSPRYILDSFETSYCARQDAPRVHLLKFRLQKGTFTTYETILSCKLNTRRVKRIILESAHENPNMRIAHDRETWSDRRLLCRIRKQIGNRKIWWMIIYKSRTTSSVRASNFYGDTLSIFDRKSARGCTLRIKSILRMTRQRCHDILCKTVCERFNVTETFKWTTIIFALARADNRDRQ